MNLKEMADSVGKMVSERLAPLRKAVSQVADSLAGIDRRLKAVEERQPEKGEPGRPGKDAGPVEITHEDIAKALREDPDLLHDVVAEHFEKHPVPAGKDADPPSDEQVARAVTAYLKDNPPAAGKDADPPTEEDIEIAVRRHLDKNPIPAGKDADPPSEEQIEKAVRHHLEKHPVPAGKDADPPSDEQVARAVTAYLKDNPPEPGRDGVGVAGATINRGGHLVLTTSDGRTHDLGDVIAKDGTDWEGAQIDYDGERSLILRSKDGTEKTLKTAMLVDRGYWRDGMACEKGDCVTHDGSLWIALDNTSARPSTQNKNDWRLGARKGRDGTTVVKYAKDDKKPVLLKGDNNDA